MARVRIKNIDKVTKNIKRVFNQAKTEKTLLKNIGEFTRDRIRFNARTGKSLDNNTTPEPFPKLKENTIRRREAIQRNRPGVVDSKFFKANRANVTLTGQLLNSLEFFIKDNAVFIGFKKRREKIFKDDETDNNKVYDNLVKLGFGFIGLDEKGQARVKKLVLDEFRRTIKKIF